MNLLRSAPLYGLLALVACGGASNSAPAPMPSTSNAPPVAQTESISPGATATTAPLPNIVGGYGGEVVLPSGSGTATLTFSLNAPQGITALTELTPTPQIAYITITAQSAFTLAAYPGLNLTAPASDMVIDMWLNYYGSPSWSASPQQLGWSSTTPGVSAICFKPQGGPINLQQGQSMYLGINGDDVLPTPMSTGTPRACPQ